MDSKSQTISPSVDTDLRKQKKKLSGFVVFRSFLPLNLENKRKLVRDLKKRDVSIVWVTKRK